MPRWVHATHALLTISLLALVAWLVATRPAATETEVAELREHIVMLETEAEESRDRIRSSAARADSAERRARMLTEQATAAASRPTAGTVSTRGEATGPGETVVDGPPSEATPEEREAARQAALAAVAGIQKQTAEIGAAMDSLGARIKSVRLRQLQPHERWDKARDVVGLNDVQVDEIRSALEERDAAYGDAAQIDHIETETGPQTVTEADERAIEDADRRYAERVDRTLTEEQRKSWRAEGFSEAFGRVRPRDGTKPNYGAPRR